MLEDAQIAMDVPLTVGEISIIEDAISYWMKWTASQPNLPDDFIAQMQQRVTVLKSKLENICKSYL